MYPLTYNMLRTPTCQRCIENFKSSEKCKTTSKEHGCDIHEYNKCKSDNISTADKTRLSILSTAILTYYEPWRENLIYTAVPIFTAGQRTGIIQFIYVANKVQNLQELLVQQSNPAYQTFNTYSK